MLGFFRNFLVFQDCYHRIGRWLGFLQPLGVAALAAGLFWGLYVAPQDYQQGDAYRLIFVHVPAAWLSLFAYAAMAASGAVALVWRVKLAEIVCVESAPVGAAFTVMALATGMLWGKPMWGAYWVWDARLTSELILLFLYLGVIALRSAIPEPRKAARAAALLAIVGIVNIPIIHYSVVWWSSLHQGPTVVRLESPAMPGSMLAPLLHMALTFTLFYVIAVLARVRCAILECGRGAAWVRELAR